MAVQQNENYRLVTIQFLKTFCSGIVAPDETKGLTYCPTYGELTGGTIIQNWSVGTTPNLDKNGIIVSSSAVLGGTYTNDQCVDQKDISLRYTVYDGIVVAASPTNISECGGSSTLSYTKSYTRYTKSITAATSTSYSTGLTSTAATDTTSGGLSWSVSPTSGASISSNILTLGKNGTVSAASRSYTVTGSWNGKSSTCTITQNALSGSYSYAASTYNNTTAVTAVADTATGFTCTGGTYKATGTRKFDVHTIYYWRDSCGTNYSNLTDDRITSTGSSSMGQKSGSFGTLNPCDTKYGSTVTNNGSISFTENGHTATVNFSQSCAGTSGQTWGWTENSRTTAYTITAAATTATAFGCTGGNFAARATGTTTVTINYIGIDNCKHTDSSRTSATTDVTTQQYDKSGSFTLIDPCGITTDVSYSDALVFTHGTASTVVNFTQQCNRATGCTPTIECLRGTDDGQDVIGGVIRESPQTLCATGCNGDVCNDSCFVNNLTINGVDATNVMSSGSAVSVSDWLKIYRSQAYVNSANGGAIGYIISENNTGEMRECYVTFTTTDSIVTTNHPGISEYGVSAACSSWTAHYVQAPYGMKWAFNNGESHAQRRIVDCSTTGYDNYKCVSENCNSQPTGYTYIIKSNVEGAKVHFDNLGTNIYINGGVAVLTASSAGSQKVTISKDGCTFNPATSTATTNTPLTMNGSCASCTTCAQANISSLMPHSAFPTSGATGDGLAQFEAKCSTGYDVVHIGGSTIASNITVSQVYSTSSTKYMVVFGNIAPNTTNKSRSETLGIRFNGTICKQFTITQNR